MPEPERIRTVVFQPRFLSDLTALIADPRAAHEFVEGAEYVLARDPEAGLPWLEVEPVIWTMGMAPIDGKTVTLLYTFDAETVWFTGIRKID